MNAPVEDEAILYGRPGCPLCFVLKREAERVARRVHLRVRWVNVLSDPILEKRYANEVPVLLFPGGRSIRGRADPGEIELAFLEAARRSVESRRSSAPREAGRRSVASVGRRILATLGFPRREDR